MSPPNGNAFAAGGLAAALAPPPVAKPVAPPKVVPVTPKAPALSTQLDRRQAYLTIVNAVHSGHLTQDEGATQLRNIGLPDEHNPFVPRTGGITADVHAVAHFLAPAKYGGTLAQHFGGKYDPHAPMEPIDAPGRRINAGIVAPGTGLLAQLLGPLEQQAVYNPGGVAALGEHPVRTAKQVAHGVVQTVEDPQHHLANAALLGWAALSGVGSALVRLAGAGKALKAGEGVGAALTRPGHAGGSLLHSPEPGTQTIYVPSHLPPGVQGPREAVPVDRLLSRNPVVRVAQRARNDRIQAKLNAPTVTSPSTSAGRAVKGTFSAQTTVGRERRAALRVDNSLNATLRTQQTQAARGLSRGEHAALGVVGVEGKEAFTNPAQTVARHVAVHEHFARLGGDVEANQQRVADLKLAQAALTNPSDRFKRAVTLTQQLSRKTEQDLIGAGHLTPATAQGRRDAIAQIYGNDKAAAGSFYFPLSRRYVEGGAPHLAPSPFQPRPGDYGTGPVAASTHVQGLHQRFTGETVAKGLVPVNVAAGVADRSARVDRLLSAERQYRDLWQASSATRRSAYDIPVRSTKQIQSDLRQFFTGLTDRLHASPDEQLQLNADEVRRLSDRLEANEHADAGVGAHVQGVRWLDRRLLANMGETNVRGPIEKAADFVTNPIRALDLYARPAYVLNLAGNLGQAGITQGVRVFPALRRAVLATRADGQANTAAIDSLMGSSLSRSFAVNTGPLHQVNEGLANAWNNLTDLYVRRSAFYHEAAKAGYTRPGDIERLLNSEQLRPKLREVTRRANKNAVDYGSLTPVEQNTIRRLVYFYPWVSRGTLWALRTLVENPGKTFTLAQLGTIGAENAHRKLGNLPAWADQLGLIPVGRRRGDLQNVLNPSSVNTYDTAAQTLDTVAQTALALTGVGKANASKTLTNFATPAATLALQASGGDTSNSQQGILGMLESLPQVQALRRAGLLGKPSKTYPAHGVGQAVGPYAAGGFFPRPLNTEATRVQARNETPTEQGRLASDLQRAVQLGLISQQDAQSMLANARTATAAQIKQARAQLSGYLRQATAAGVTPTNHP